jgi:hypothetical protein
VTVISAYARALAVRSGVAAPIASVRHLHLADAPLAIVPLTMAGEANAPLAALVGTAEHEPALLVVPQPRDRGGRFAFARAFADVVLREVERCATGGSEPAKAPRTAKAPEPGDGAAPEAPEAAVELTRFLDAPQILVPNRAGIEFLRLFGRSTRFRRTEGEYAVPIGVPLLGCWLTYLAGRAEHPGSSALLAATEALTAHWATGQSALEDANLAALLAWIDPPDGLTGAVAARRAEDPAHSPPAGPATDPMFDNRVLAPAIRRFDAALVEAGDRDDPRVAAAEDEVADALRSQLEPTWRLVWRAVRLLRALPEGASVSRRWERDRASFSAYHAYLADGGMPQPRRDGAVAAARRLGQLEREHAEYEAQTAFDDPLVLANQRVRGEAFVGRVVTVERARRRENTPGGRLVTRPLVEVLTVDPVRLAEAATVESPARRGQVGEVLGVRPGADGLVVTLELAGGIGRGKVPPPGSVPELGETVTYTSLRVEGGFPVSLPGKEDTPWTHGGPPPEYEPTDHDAREVWQ